MTRQTSAGDVANTGAPDDTVQELLDELAVSPESNLISVLQAVQSRRGYLPPETLAGISRRMRLPLSRVYGVVSFYTQFYTEPRGRHTIRVCRGTACHVRGAGKIAEAVEDELKINDGETTDDLAFSFESVACLGTCFLAPVMMIDNSYYGDLAPDKARKILRSYREKQ